MLDSDFQQIISSNLDWELFANKTILITGANGFLPAYMTETLLWLNESLLLLKPCKVIALVRNDSHAKVRFDQYLVNKNFKIIVQNISREITINEKVDFIVHAASPASPKYYNDNPVGVILANVFGTKNALDVAVKNKVEGFLFFSSGEVYGLASNGGSITEDSFGYLDPTSLRACYGESKRMGENLCVSYGSQYNVPIKIVRPFHTYGPGMKLDDGRVFADFVKNIVNSENIELKSDGSSERPFCYLADATIAFFTILLKGEKNNAYNMANPKQVVSIKELANTLVNLYPEKKLKAIFVLPNENYLESPIKEQLPDITKINSLGWSPVTTIQDGFKKTIESYL